MTSKRFLSSFVVLILLISCFQFTSSASTPPEIVFEKIDAAGLIQASDLSDFTIATSDAQHVELYIDDVIVGTDDTPPYSFDVAHTTLGTRKALAKVKTTDGEYFEAEKFFNVYELINGANALQTYEAFKSADLEAKSWEPRPGGNTAWTYASTQISALKYQVYSDGTEENGKSKPGNGKCMVISYPKEGANDYPEYHAYIRVIPEGNLSSTSLVHFETDFYATGLSNGVGSYTFGVEATINGSRNVQNHATYDYRGLTINGKTYTMAQDTWHHLTIEYDWAIGTISAWIGDTQIVYSETITNHRPCTGLYWYRLAYGKEGGEFRLDNTSIYLKIKSPHSKGLKDGSECVNYTDSSAVIRLSGPLKTIDTTGVALKNEIGNVPLKSVIFDTESNLTIEPVDGFEPANDYILTIPASTDFTYTGSIVKPLVIQFKTSARDVDITNGKIKTAGDEAFFEATVTNTSSSPQTLTAFLAVYENGIFKSLLSSSAISVPVDGGTATIKTPGYTITSGETIKAFILNSEQGPISNKFYTLDIE